MTQARSGETQPKTRHQSTKKQHQNTKIWQQKCVFQKFLVTTPKKKRLIGTPGIHIPRLDNPTSFLENTIKNGGIFQPAIS